VASRSNTPPTAPADNSPLTSTPLRLPNRFNLTGGSITQAHTSRGTDLHLYTLLLLACPQQGFSQLSPSLRTAIDTLRALPPPSLAENLQLSSSSSPSSLFQEVQNLRRQMGILAEFCLCGSAAITATPTGSQLARNHNSHSSSRSGTTTRPQSAESASGVRSKRLRHRFVSMPM